jgi:hypothetical protein
MGTAMHMRMHMHIIYTYVCICRWAISPYLPHVGRTNLDGGRGAAEPVRAKDAYNYKMMRTAMQVTVPNAVFKTMSDKPSK